MAKRPNKKSGKELMPATIEEEEIAPFKPEPWQINVLNDRSPVIVLDGPAGGGKSRVLSEKVHALCLHYPGMTAVVSRKKREDMDKSTISLMTETVIDIEHEPICEHQVKRDRIVYHHPQGKSELIFTGMHTKEQREGTKSIGKSGAVDFWWPEEGSEFDEEDYNIMLRAMRGTAMGWTQVAWSTNAAHKLHWINRRLIIGREARRYISSYDMNPYNAHDYGDRMNSIQGVMGLRLNKGVWTDGDNLVIDTWLDDYEADDQQKPILGNVTPAADYIPGYGPVVWYLDDGYSGTLDPVTKFFTERSNPRVFLLCQHRKDGQTAVFANHYKVQELTGAHVQEVIGISKKNGWPLPDYAIYDGASPSLGGQLIKAGISAKGVRVKIDEGVKELNEHIGLDINGVRQVIVHPRAQYLCWEMGSWSKNASGEPIDAHNHGPDALKYGEWHKAYGGLNNVTVIAPGVNMEEISLRLAETLARIEKKYEKILGEQGAQL